MYEKLKQELNTISYYSKMEFLLEVAETGNVDAMYLLGKLEYEHDNMERAFRWFQEAAKGGNADALFYIGTYYEHKFDTNIVEKDILKAVEYYENSAKAGSALGMYEIAIRKLNSSTRDKDEVEGILLLEKAAALGNVKACEKLADCYRNGWYVDADIEKAIYYLEDALFFAEEQI